MKPTRTVLLLALMISVTACERSTAPEAAAPVDPAAVSTGIPDASPTTPSIPVDHLSVQVVSDKIAYQDAAARVEADSLVSTGKAGFVMFGPYVTLAPGRYRLAVQGSVAQLPAGAEVVFDVVSKGQVFGQESITATHPEAGEIVGFEFELADAVPDLEVRARVADDVDLRIESYEVAKVN